MIRCKILVRFEKQSGNSIACASVFINETFLRRASLVLISRTILDSLFPGGSPNLRRWLEGKILAALFAILERIFMRAFKKIWNVVGTLFVTLMVVLAILLVGVRVIGLTPFAVLSGSMEPTYHVGALIYVKSIQPQDVQVGMPLTFVVDESLLVATHRVIDIETVTTREEAELDESGNPVLDENGDAITREVPLDEPAYYFQTKGDANEVADGSPVYYKNVVGTPVFSIPYLGYLSNWLQTRQGTIMGISIALAILLMTFIPDILGSGQEKPKKKRRRAKKRNARTNQE